MDVSALMPRIRSIKPEFFTHPEVVTVSIPARLLFVALLTQADDDGRLFDQPRKIAGNTFGDDDKIDCESLLSELAAKDRIVRYEVGGKPCLQILNFDKHQVIPPSKRRPSAIPKLPRGSQKAAQEQDDGSQTDTRNGTGTGSGTGNGMEKPTSPPSEDDDGFEDFWNLYPRRNGKRLSKNKAAAKWRALKPDEKEAATRGAKFYALACDSGVTIAADCFRWLRDKSFQDWQEPAVVTNGKPDPTSRAGTPAYLPYQPADPDPACEHSDPICEDCRRANVEKLRELMAGIG